MRIRCILTINKFYKLTVFHDSLNKLVLKQTHELKSAKFLECNLCEVKSIKKKQITFKFYLWV